MPIKETDIPALFEYLGLDPTKINTVEDFKTNHDTAFIPMASAENNPEVVSKINGKVIGAVQTKIGQMFKEHGIEFDGAEIKGKPWEDITKIGLSKMVALSTKAIDEMKAQLGDPTKQVKEWENKYGELEKKYTAELGVKQTLQQEYEGLKNQVLTEKKQGRVNEYKSKAWGDFKWATGLNDLMKEGFQAKIEKKAGGRKVSKEKTVMKILRLFFEGK